MIFDFRMRVTSQQAARLLVLLTMTMAIAGCERPLEEAPLPRLAVIEPDLSVIQSERQVQLAVRVLSPRGIEIVVAEGDTLIHREEDNTWRGETVLSNGLNRIIFAVTDGDMNVALDTVYAMVDHFTAAQTHPQLPEGRGGHSATRLSDGTIYVIGGAQYVEGPSSATALVWRSQTTHFEPLEDELHTARVGHAATLLPDQRILITGGAVQHRFDFSSDDLVQTVEMFDVSSQRFVEIPVEGDPIQRVYHTATLHEEDGAVFVDLYGGQGATGPSTYGIRADVRRFRVEDSLLVALDPAPGPELDEALYGHSQVELYPNRLGNRRFHVGGALFTESSGRNVSLELEYRPDVGLLQFPVGGMQEPRKLHGAALLDDGFVGIFGGRGRGENEATGSVEIYSAESQSFFRYPEATRLVSRFGHTATKLENRRILLLGGFLPTGGGAVTTELYRVPDFHPRDAGGVQR